MSTPPPGPEMVKSRGSGEWWAGGKVADRVITYEYCDPGHWTSVGLPEGLRHR